MKQIIFIGFFLILKASVSSAQQSDLQQQENGIFNKVSNIENLVVRHEKGEFAAWPANNGIWSWKKGNEILVGYTAGPYVMQSGHKVTNPKNALARSKDGGKTWKSFSPEIIADESITPSELAARINFKHPNFAFRVRGVVYGNRFLRMMLCRLSKDNGKTWGDEIIIRDDFNFDGKGFADFGYPRVIQRKDGKIVAIYYFATEERPEQHIACSIFSLDDLQDVVLKR